MKNNIEKTRDWSFMSYASREELQPLLDAAEHWALVRHDKDEATPHWHILVHMSTTRASAGLIKLVDSDQNTFAQRLRTTRKDAYDYLDHHKEDGKAQYDSAEIESDDKGWWESQKTRKEQESAAEDECEQMIDDIINRVSMRQMARKYGKDFIKNHRAYRDFAFKVYSEEHDGNVPEWVDLVSDKELLRLKREHEEEVAFYCTKLEMITGKPWRSFSRSNSD